MPDLLRIAGIAAACAMALAGCSDDAPPAAPNTSAASASPAATQPKELTARERAAQLAALAPQEFDARYRLDSAGKQRPDAAVRMRTTPERFRLDVERGASTAVLITNSKGVIACQVEDQGKKQPKDKACFLVAKRPAAVPPLFDPQIQRLFRSTTTQISQLRSDVTVKRTKSWQAPGSLGTAECFSVRGKEVERGTYCYLAKPGDRIGLLARVVFPSGSLNLRSASRVVRGEPFVAPAKPTPLPKPN